MTYYLRLECVNLSNFIYDTNNISTIRGGGLLLLDAAEEVATRFSDFLFPVTIGASSGLYELKADSADNAGGENQVLQFLRAMNSGELQHATIMVDLFQEDDFITAKESLLALNRWQQMRSPSLSVASDESQNGPCSIDMVRPAGEHKGPDGMPISDSVHLRREYGREQKKKVFYQKQTDLTISRDFVGDLDQLTAEPATKSKLHHKMAVIYIDGNGFGELQRRVCKSKESQRRFDETLKGNHKRLLRKLIGKIEEEQDGWVYRKPDSGKELYRLETLLWGGDEVMWVVQAWQGWQVLTDFYKVAVDWSFDESSSKRHHLRYAAGMVFCHHNAPIAHMRAARNLACRTGQVQSQ